MVGVACAPVGRACAGLGDHRQRALRQIADVVGEIGVHAGDDRLMRIAAVLAERDFAQEEIAHRVEPVGVDHRLRADDVADRLRHFLAAVEQEAVHDDLFRHGQSGRHQEGRPVDGVEARDVLADHMRVRRPEFRPRAIVREAGRGDVVGQRVDPDIHHMLRVARNGHAPFQRRAADREVGQALASRRRRSRCDRSRA